MSALQANETGAASRPRGGWLGMLASVGPGIVVTGSVIGSGELINVPVQAATFGFIMLWAVLLSCVIKYFVQVEIARYCLVHNRTTFQALGDCPGPLVHGASWIGIVYMLGYLITTLPIIGIIGALGGLMHGLWPLPMSAQSSVLVWGTLNVLLALALLWRGAYDRLESLVAILVAGFSISVGIGVLLIQRTEYRISADDIASGLTLSLGADRRAGAYAVISLMGALGVAANELFMYPYWVLEKGYAKELGDPADAGWAGRARHWINTIRLDAGLATVIATVVTAGFFLLGAAVLHRQGVKPEGLQVLEQISSVYTESFGTWSRNVFYLGAFCTLFSTLVVYTAASGRMWADMFACMGLVNRDDEGAMRRSHRWMQSLWLAGLFAAFLVMPKQPAQWIVLGHFVLGGFMTPLLMLAVAWMAFHTDARVRMGRWWAAALVGSIAIILACVLTGLAHQYAPSNTGAAGWIPLFDGKSLEGWRASEHKDSCRVEDGVIVMGGGERSHLFYDGPVNQHDFKNFELEAEVKTEPHSNSGIFFHTQYQEEGWPAKGYEAQVNNSHEDWRRTGSLYAVQDTHETPVQDGEWFDYHITVNGKRITFAVNGKTVLDYTEPGNPPQPDPTRDRRLSHGTIALQAHDPGSKVYFRNIRIKPLPDENNAANDTKE